MPYSPRPEVCIVSTGGTFEKSYDPVTEGLTFLEDSCVPEILSKCKTNGIVFRSLMKADSRDFGELERKKILTFVSGLSYNRFVIIHGTSSILETARLFQNADLAGVYVFTGAMTPYRYSRTEAAFNLGGAIALARFKSQGVFLNMHGEVYDPSRSHKDELKARFFHLAEE